MNWLLAGAVLLLLVPSAALPFVPVGQPPTEQVSSAEHSPLQREIIVALLDSVVPSFTSPPEMEAILDGYTWSAGETTYTIRIRWLSDVAITGGALARGIDVLVVPGIGKEFRRPFFSSGSWKTAIRQFVAQGGGYFGTCGGANMGAQGLVAPEQRGWTSWTAWEWCMHRSALGLAPVLSYQDMADPGASSLRETPERVGQSAYIWYNLSIEGSGLCQHCPVNTSHPIFSGYGEQSRIMRWVGGPALIPTSGHVTVLAWYPGENMSGPHGNASTQVHAWRFDGGNAAQPLDFWDLTDQVIETHLAGKPAGVACTYGQGRVVLFGNHPEHPVWRGGQLVEHDGPRDRMLLKGLFRWEDRQPLPEDYNWWVVRRSVAWAAGVPDQELPPVIAGDNVY